MVTPLYVGIAAFAIIALFINVVRNRFKHEISLGDGDNAELIRARSVYGNFIEIVPFILILMFMMETQGYSAIIIHGFGLTIILSRIFHILGIYHKTTAGKLRVLGSVLALALMAAGGILLLISYII